MKRLWIAVILVCVLLSLAACGKVSGVELAEWEPSELYSDGEIRSAMKAVKNYFRREFDGCSLLNIRYPGDGEAEMFREWAEQYGADEAIVLYSSFQVGSSGGDGSLNPNSTYDNWAWILVRDQGGTWEHKTHGYG